MDCGMSSFRYLLFTALLFQAFVMTLGVGDGEEDCIGFAGQAPIQCYECMSVTDDHYCGDPFNETNPQHQSKRCKEYCVKWTRKTLSGKTLIQRTCSSKLEIKLRKTPVCIHESRPSEGMLCFCNEDHCNSAVTITNRNFIKIIVLAFIVIVCNIR
ncbi:protein quiver-like [Ruditapes philippinarum]|uniref:protein quiver-like n=1 Tax=Ruditapes philippinarum TaxID=129788 RepID=UPI00295AF6F9|nr:protein quiver-like [Ruditapes philippinarum]